VNSPIKLLYSNTPGRELQLKHKSDRASVTGISVGLLLVFLLVQSVDAMSSPGYKIEWNNLLSGGGGTAASAGYHTNVTIGQTVSGVSSSPGYRV
jgi:hypothetical protein